MKRFCCDWSGNLVFFVPLVIALTPPLREDTAAAEAYIRSAVIIAAVGGRAYSLFLKHIWYKLWREEF